MPARPALIRRLLVVTCSLLLLSGAMEAVAHAEPDTPVSYPSGASATRVSGLGFDTCTAPALSALRAWMGTSPYKVINIYFGGRNRGCAQPNLTRSWVEEAQAMGWRLLPTYFGDQPSCVFGSKPYRYSLTTAASRGKADGEDAVAQATALGLRPGSTLYADVEHYDRLVSGCPTAVRRYLSAWTKALHGAGSLAGAYVHQNSGLVTLSSSYSSTDYARLDAVWMARWDEDASLFGWPTAPDQYWPYWQRVKQYQGGHDETWGGVTINIDTDALQAPVATVSRTFLVTSSSQLAGRTGPSTAYPVVGTFTPGDSVEVLCQGRGQKVGSTGVWDRLASGVWVTDYYVSTPSKTGFSGGIPRCSYPGQVTSSTPLNARTGPGASFPTTGRALPRGALAYVACQKTGSKVGTTTVWNRLTDDRWVTDYYVSNRSNTSWSLPVPRCP